MRVWQEGISCIEIVNILYLGSLWEGHEVVGACGVAYGGRGMWCGIWWEGHVEWHYDCEYI